MFSNYLRTEEAVGSGVTLDLKHGGKAKLREYNCPAMHAAMIETVKAEVLSDDIAMRDVPFAERQRIENLAFVKGCVVGLFDPDSEAWVASELFEELLMNPTAHVLLAELKNLSRDTGLFAPGKKKTSTSSGASSSSSAPTKPGAKNTRSTAKAGPTSIKSGSGQEILDVRQHV